MVKVGIIVPVHNRYCGLFPENIRQGGARRGMDIAQGEYLAIVAGKLKRRK